MTTPSNTSFKEELGQILDRYQFHFTHQFTHKEDPFTKDQALTSIINLVDKDYENGLHDGQELQKYMFIRMIRHRKKQTAPNSGAGRELKDIERELMK